MKRSKKWIAEQEEILRREAKESLDNVYANHNRFVPCDEKLSKPPIGLMPRSIYERNRNNERFSEVCGAISRYYAEGLPINIEWVEEYNELLYLNNEEED